MSVDKNYFRGLKDVAACETHISFVDPLGALYYVGYDIDRLLGRVSYEEIIHLLLFRRLPKKSELEDIKSKLFSEMEIPEQIVKSIKNAPKTCHPMEILRTEISHLGEYDQEPKDTSDSANINRALSLIAKVPTIVAAIHRIKKGQELATIGIPGFNRVQQVGFFVGPDRLPV